MDTHVDAILRAVLVAEVVHELGARGEFCVLRQGHLALHDVHEDAQAVQLQAVLQWPDDCAAVLVFQEHAVGAALARHVLAVGGA